MRVSLRSKSKPTLPRLAGCEWVLSNCGKVGAKKKYIHIYRNHIFTVCVYLVFFYLTRKAIVRPSDVAKIVVLPCKVEQIDIDLFVHFKSVRREEAE